VFFGLQLFLLDNARFDAIAGEFLDSDHAAAAAVVVVVSMIDYCHGSTHGYGTSMQMSLQLVHVTLSEWQSVLPVVMSHEHKTTHELQFSQ
jgi:hypothetical protein